MGYHFHKNLKEIIISILLILFAFQCLPEHKPSQFSYKCVGYISMEAPVTTLFIIDTMLYALDNPFNSEGNLLIYSIKDPEEPQFIKEKPRIIPHYYSYEAKYPYLFLLTYEEIEAISLEMDRLGEIVHIPYDGRPRDMKILDSIAFIADEDRGFVILNLSDISNPKLLFAEADTHTGLYAKTLDILDNIAVVEYGGRIRGFNIEELTKPKEVFSFVINYPTSVSPLLTDSLLLIGTSQGIAVYHYSQEGRVELKLYIMEGYAVYKFLLKNGKVFGIYDAWLLVSPLQENAGIEKMYVPEIRDFSLYKDYIFLSKEFISENSILVFKKKEKE